MESVERVELVKRAFYVFHAFHEFHDFDFLFLIYSVLPAKDVRAAPKRTVTVTFWYKFTLNGCFTQICVCVILGYTCVVFINVKSADRFFLVTYCKSSALISFSSRS